MNTTQYVYLFLILVVHFFVTNVIEKIFTSVYINNDLRPDAKGKYTSTSDLGMPSGHTEIITILCMVLVFQNVIPLIAAILIIFAMILQRVVSRRHTVSQTTFGLVTGLIYALIYQFTGISFTSLLILLVITFILVLLIEFKLSSQIKEGIPEWIDPSLHKNIQTKQDRGTFTNCTEILFDSITNQDKKIFVSYMELEKEMDAFVNSIQSTGKNYDYVIGIKTGGAILTSYIATKLGIPYYFIKPENKKFHCRKKDFAQFFSMKIYHEQKNVDELEMCETIDDDISGSKILLIDESSNTGLTVYKSIEYLFEDKHVQCIDVYIFAKNKFFKSLTNSEYIIWPWGYDN